MSELNVFKVALHGIGWSVVQNWGGRVFTFVLFIILARFLTPSQFGLVAGANIVIWIISMVAEFGFGDAIVQRQNYENADGNLPFYMSILLAVILAVISIVNAPYIANWLGVSGVELIIVALAAIVPLSTLAHFQEVHYRRAFAYKRLATRFFIANITGGLLAIAAAMAGWGAWSLVVQIYVTTFVGLIWLWSKPHWWPGLIFRVAAFRQLSIFAMPVLLMQILDFSAIRLFELSILSRYGVAVFGLYTVGAKLAQTLMQLLQAALNNITLSVLSRIAHDKNRISRIYRRVIFVASIVFMPIFVGCSALIHEIIIILFGSGWVGAENIARSLLLLCAVQSVQFINGCYLSALGLSGRVFFVSSIKNCAMFFVVWWGNDSDVEHFVMLFALSQLASTPFSFGLACRELQVGFGEMLATLLPSILACLLAYIVVHELRSLSDFQMSGLFVQTILLSAVFALVYLLVLGITGFRQIVHLKQFVVQRIGRVI